MKTQRFTFNPGQTRMTQGALNFLQSEDVLHALRRHLQGDWGDCNDRGAEMNDQSVLTGGRILSIYHDRFGGPFWIITESDRSATTIQLPGELNLTMLFAGESAITFLFPDKS